MMKAALQYTLSDNRGQCEVKRAVILMLHCHRVSLQGTFQSQLRKLALGDIVRVVLESSVFHGVCLLLCAAWRLLSHTPQIQPVA